MPPAKKLPAIFSQKPSFQNPTPLTPNSQRQIDHPSKCPLKTTEWLFLCYLNGLPASHLAMCELDSKYRVNEALEICFKNIKHTTNIEECAKSSRSSLLYRPQEMRVFNEAWAGGGKKAHIWTHFFFPYYFPGSRERAGNLNRSWHFCEGRPKVTLNAYLHYEKCVRWLRLALWIGPAESGLSSWAAMAVSALFLEAPVTNTHGKRDVAP